MVAARKDLSMRIDLPDLSAPELPPLAALFLIYFDLKAGYTLGWRRSLPEVKLEGIVEYKSLPSGLHNVKEDLIYFVQDDYAGLSAFVNAPAGQEQRHATMIAVGVLAPLSSGRLGRSWRHAQHLKELASTLVSRPGITSSDAKIGELEDYWQTYRLSENDVPSLIDSPQESPSSLSFKPAGSFRMGVSRAHKHTRNRSTSNITTLTPQGQSLSRFHPARSLTDLLSTFGPLIFPLYRAALLRKRILVLCEAPVELACKFVYDISILSTVPLATSELLPAASPPSRLRPLFSIGVHDIPLLDELASRSQRQPSAGSPDDGVSLDDSQGGWVACSTDAVLSMKSELYDVLITLPPAHASEGRTKSWPKVESSDGTSLRATQRDMRRYISLKRALSRGITTTEEDVVDGTSFAARTDGAVDENDDDDDDVDDDDEQTLLLPRNTTDVPDDVSSIIDEKLVEPLSWSALAYSSFMWWASAGEKRADLDEEFERDEALMNGPDGSERNSPSQAPRPRSSSSNTELLMNLHKARPELALVAYFHRLTTLIISSLADLIDSTEVGEEDEEENEQVRGDGHVNGDNDVDDQEPLFVSSEDLMRLGLDVWSDSDRTFVEDMVREYFGRHAEVQGATVECCGVRIY